jgi:hypothetical protein
MSSYRSKVRRNIMIFLFECLIVVLLMETIWLFPCCSLSASTTPNFYFRIDLCIGWHWTILQECKHREIPEGLLQSIWHCVSGEALLSTLQLPLFQKWLWLCTLFTVLFFHMDFAPYSLFCFFTWSASDNSIFQLTAEWCSNEGSCWARFRIMSLIQTFTAPSEKGFCPPELSSPCSLLSQKSGDFTIMLTIHAGFIRSCCTGSSQGQIALGTMINLQL